MYGLDTFRQVIHDVVVVVARLCAHKLSTETPHIVSRRIDHMHQGEGTVYLVEDIVFGGSPTGHYTIQTPQVQQLDMVTCERQWSLERTGSNAIDRFAHV